MPLRYNCRPTNQIIINTMGPHFARVSVVGNAKSVEELDTALADLHLPNPSSVSKGRNVTAGYARGWGLEFGRMADIVGRDPVYIESLELARSRTVLPEHRLMNLFMIMKFGMQGILGDILEFGSYKGGCAIFMANVARRLGLDCTVYAFDTFEGMPPTDDVLDLHFAGNFDDTNYSDLAAYVEKTGLENLKLVKGLFSDTAPGVLAGVDRIAIAHIDCDIHDAVKYCLSAVQPKMHRAGGYIILDDPLTSSCLGALQAVEDWIVQENIRAEQAYPHLVYRFPKLREQDKN